MIQKNKSMMHTIQERYSQFVYPGIMLVALLILGWFSFRAYKVYQGKRLQQVLSECLEEFQKNGNIAQPQWGEMQLMAELASQQASGSSLQPFFAALQAQAAARQHNIDGAIVLMQQAIDALPETSVYRSYFALTKALMQLDASSQEEKDRGLQDLQALADDEKNSYRDAALYHLGYYYEAHGNPEKAHNQFKTLVGLIATFNRSPWLMLAQEKLAATYN